MATISEALSIAAQHHRAGRLHEAEQIARQVLAAAPNQPDALWLLGIIASQSGQNETAVAYLERAVGLNGNSADLHNHLGAAYFALQRLTEAAASYRRCLQLKPDYAEVYCNLGDALFAQGQFDDAIANYRTCVRLKPDFAQARFNLGNACYQRGKASDAIANYRRAIALQPDFAEAHNNLGGVLRDSGKPEEAVACFTQALRLRPANAGYHVNLGIALKALGNLSEAAACFVQAAHLKPDFADAHQQAGIVQNLLGFTDEAAASLRRALELKPEDPAALNNLGIGLKDAGQLDEAIVHLRRALNLKPDYAAAYHNLGAVLKDQSKLDEALACYSRAIELQPDSTVAHSNLVYLLVFCPGYDAERIFESSREFDRILAAPLAGTIKLQAVDPDPDRRLRIGYVSSNFCGHVVGRNLLPLFREHDHRQFEVYCYADVYRDDYLTARFRGYSDTWRETQGLSDARLAQQIADDRIDILIDLTLHMARNRLLVFARKPAPVQATFAGYPGTTGLSAIDYRLTDPHLDPPELFDRWYSEESIRLPDSFWCFDPIDEGPQPNSLPAATNGFITFGCFNNFCKVNASCLKLWARVLGAVDGSRLLLLTHEGRHRQDTLDALEQVGVAPDRVGFIGRQTRPGYLEQFHRIDIALDTVPYNGHTVSLDSLWMGVPVVTRVGSTVVGRAGLSQMTNLGMPELIAYSDEQYVEIAADLARNGTRLSEMRRTLRPRMQASPLMDAPRFARSVESALREMWRRWCARPR